MTTNHRISLGATGWSLWREGALRSAGFPADRALDIASEQAAAAAHALIVGEDALRDLRAIARRTARRQERAEAVGPAVTNGLMSHLADGVQTLRRDYESTYASDRPRSLSRLHRWLADARVHEAIVWQNRVVWNRALQAFLDDPECSTHRVRRRAELAVKYLQRYAVKNETIGFFGPVAWVTLDPNRPRSEAIHGADLLARRRVFCEGWTIDAIVDVLQEHIDCIPWSHPRLAAHLFEEPETTTWSSAAGPLTLDALDREIVRRCDGRATVRQIIRAVPAPPHMDREAWEGACLDRCRALRDRGLLHLRVNLPRSGDALQALVDWLEAIDDEPTREKIRQFLAPFIDAVARVAAAAGSPDDLDAALERVERVFTTLTGEAASRRGGQPYAGRTLVYEDTCRDVTAVIGADVLEPLSRVLPTLLQSARWLLQEATRRYERETLCLFARMTSTSSRPVSLHALIDTMLDARVITTYPATPPWLDEIRLQLEERWGSIWMRRGLLSADRSLALACADVQSDVDEAFPVDDDGAAYYLSPDVLIAKHPTSGAFTIVLGEIHLINTLSEGTNFSVLHPDPAALMEYARQDGLAPLVGMLLGRFSPQRSAWGANGRLNAVHCVLAPNARLPVDGRLLRPVDVLIERRGDCLWARDRAGTIELPFTTLCADLLVVMLAQQFSLWPRMAHRPRVMLDGVVIGREAWTCPARELGFVTLATESARFLGAQRWARARELGRFVFVKVPGEPKPFFLDFASTCLVELFSTATRHAFHDRPTADVTFTEMLPGFKELWLQDGTGQAYTSELRFVAVPPRPA